MIRHTIPADEEADCQEMRVKADFGVVFVEQPDLGNGDQPIEQLICLSISQARQLVKVLNEAIRERSTE